MLRGELVAKLRARGTIRTDAVAAAFESVPRQMFVPEADLETAYGNESVVTKHDERGAAISSVSAPWLQATMLEQTELLPGMRVLEVGSGGYNAALIAEIVGSSGEVVTVDIDAEVAERTRHFLAQGGYERVTVVHDDAGVGVPDRAPFDRVIVTAGVWDIPPAWIEQLTARGRLVVPLRMRGLTRSVAFDRHGECLRSVGHTMCGFVPIQGASAHADQYVPLRGEQVGLRIDDHGPSVIGEALRAALHQPRVEVWSGVRFGGAEPFDGLYLWLASHLPTLALLTRKRTDTARRLVDPSSPSGTPTLLDAGGFAYHTFRQTDPNADIYEFGAYAHGSDAAKLAERVVEQIRGWDRHDRPTTPTITVDPVDTPDERLPPGHVTEKHHTKVTISWA
ncbi:MAG: methyltransferase, FxLD system [Nocardioidaceae bacterium]